MNQSFIIKSETSSYIAIPVPKNSKGHILKVSTCFFESYLFYRSAEETLICPPYKVHVNAEIIGLASSISESFKNLLIKNNILLREWVELDTVSKHIHEELLIIQLPNDEEKIFILLN